MATPGRRRDSSVWEYFNYLEEDNKSVCLIEKPNGSQCGQTFNGKFPTNLKTHLKTKHPQEFKHFEECEAKKKELGKEKI